MMKILFIILTIIVLLIIYDIYELYHFKITLHPIISNQLMEEHRLVFLSDLHGKTYGKKLLEAIRFSQPEIILIGGDVVTKTKLDQLYSMIPFMEELVKIAPVFYAFGNHEGKIQEVYTNESEDYKQAFFHYRTSLEAFGVCFLDNSSVSINLGTDQLSLTGLTLPDSYFVKRKQIQLTKEDALKWMPEAKKGNYHILLAHSPSFISEYLDFSFDLILSGHTHGGLVRFPWIGSLISPEFILLPKYDGGSYFVRRTDDVSIPFIVSKGLGNHTFPIRFLDSAELNVIELAPNAVEKDKKTY